MDWLMQNWYYIVFFVAVIVGCIYGCMTGKVKEWLKKYTVDSTDYVIMDEYDRIVPFDEFFELVDWKQKDQHCKSNPDNLTYSRNVDGYRFVDEEFS